MFAPLHRFSSLCGLSYQSSCTPLVRHFRIYSRRSTQNDLSLAKMLSGANAFRISDHQLKSELTRIQCNNVTCLAAGRNNNSPATPSLENLEYHAHNVFR